MKTQHIFKQNNSNNPFFGVVVPVLLVLCVLMSFYVGTEYIAYHTGQPLTWQPYMGMVWAFQAYVNKDDQSIYLEGLRISAVIMIVSILLTHTTSFIIRRRVKKTDIHGSARWANEDDLMETKLLDQDEGLYIGMWEKQYLRENSEAHTICVAPTGSGKGVGVVVPNLLSWPGSVIVFDLKGENYLKTSGYRKTELNQNIMAFNPTCADMIINKKEIDDAGFVWGNFSGIAIQRGWGEMIDENRINLKADLNLILNELSDAFGEDAIKVQPILLSPHPGTCACWNPLAEIRMGLHETSDVQLIVENIIDPFGKGELDHWHRSAKSLLTGVILHVLYARKDKSLAGVVDLLSDPKRPIYEVINSMLLTEHDPKGIYHWIDKSTGTPTKIHPNIAQVAREMKNKQFEELSGIVSTALSFITPYRDPIMARNTGKSDFTISGLIKGEKFSSLYIIVPPSDLERVVPLTRLMVNLLCSRTMENSSLVLKEDLSKKQRVLLMIDEFPSLGKMEILKNRLSIMRGYGLRAVLICQDLDQLNEIYGHNNPILGHCKIRIFYATNSDITARRISAYAGESTIIKYSKSYSDSSENVSEGASEIKRQLILPDEVMRLPETDVLIFLENKNPIYATKIVYFKDIWFSKMSQLPPVPVSDRIIAKNDFTSITDVVEFKSTGDVDSVDVKSAWEGKEDEGKSVKSKLDEILKNVKDNKDTDAEKKRKLCP
jgi:type IV secretory pathway TraG/TraD family ATPase VirD4